VKETDQRRRPSGRTRGKWNYPSFRTFASRSTLPASFSFNHFKASSGVTTSVMYRKVVERTNSSYKYRHLAISRVRDGTRRTHGCHIHDKFPQWF